MKKVFKNLKCKANDDEIYEIMGPHTNTWQGFLTKFHRNFCLDHQVWKFLLHSLV